MATTPSRKTVFVTVGTTRFDALIEAMDTQEVADVLVARGFTHLVMQVGNAARQRSRLLAEGFEKAGTLSNGLGVAWFDYSPTLAATIRDAALVISHAGAGSAFETLAAGVPLVVVPNPLLMDDHQAELARKLEAMGVLFAARLDTLPEILKSADFGSLAPYEPGDARPIVEAVDALVGRQAGKAE
ncbi:hypothetical protein QBZ16_005005 [Prototheca wickerhamii]|uniref:Glycosyl transferase family 28 C-terminal domain-containing protein n=1 Tax=Prototheca wickerhamii TaxID=3111 RepID=A0AAD9IGM9_PROWI|nr:hypothetical protein QBZ16_005005 [Prototheca wickerhamii]